MKRLAALAIILTPTLLSAHAQRGGGHGGFSVHSSAPASHGSFSSGTSFHYTGGPLNGNRSIGSVPAMRFGGRSNPFSARRLPVNRFRSRNSFGRPIGIGYGFGSTTYLSDPYPGELYTDYVNQAQGAPDPSPQGDSNDYANTAPQLEPATPQLSAQPHPSRPAPAPEEAVTLVFKDGRPAQQIHNYLASRTSIMVIDGTHHRDIPVGDLDLPATVKANQEVGVEFSLPGEPR